MGRDSARPSRKLLGLGRRRSGRAWNGTGRALGRRGFYLVTNFGDLREPDLVQQRDHVAMERHLFGAQRNLYVRVLLVELIKPR
jgi:hypothetical protein